MKTILIAGGTGFIGKTLEKHFSKKGFYVKILSRNPKRDNEILWDAKTLEGSWVSHLENLDVLINLTGKTINCRFTDANKKAIKESRVIATELLGKAIDSCKNPPKLWMNSSTTSIYKEAFTEEQTEDSTVFGNDFEAEVATVWEKAFYKTKNPKTRKIVIRTSIVFGNDDGAFVPLKKLTQFGLGGKQGNGKQMVSWIHETDFARAVDFLIHKEDTKGAFNFCVPKPTDNATMMKDFRKAMQVPVGIPSPKFILKIGAFFMQTEPELILNSRNVVPKKLLENGFKFQFPTIKAAVKDLID
ncbi:TIGR01777 family oxidoreductase [Lacinutrix sp. C3R15]|uniref:TIGR01777 family oxidoreductase n=1 Tax=Flavobacteriaceae TaxID=49546 RepID=UPI001C095AC3|nr:MULTISPECIES: TIGR01777 family oxidoreductase [Flavobacteriaceae]MBU2939337.1 TIGR01777 family oxidoreductase [Lacinutrix sp. C3R15]MDO6622652.1 TIGR01777 family oxidoreductase [Oceanihabitans sp. 1_MG-2023]